MITIGIDPKQLESLKQSLQGKASRLPREVATAINATAKDVRTAVARDMRKELPSSIKIRTIKKVIKSKSIASKDLLSATIQLNKGYPFSLKYFSPRQNKKGVNVRMNPKIKGAAGKTLLPRAFIINRWGGNVYERINKGPGSGRGPLKKHVGPTPGEIFHQAGIVVTAVKTARRQLPLQMQRRIRFLMLQSSGGLRGNSTGRKGRGNQ